LPGEIFIEVEGKDLHHLENEAGGHRIQRVPPTERKGRVHTSTVTVAIIDPEIQVKEYRDSDFRIEWYSGTGAGGQHRNKHQNSCRITYLPTGQTATAQCRSRQNSLEQAKSALLEQLEYASYKQTKSNMNHKRKTQVGSGMRGDKIRTIRFQDNVVLDHRTNKRMTTDMYMKGYMDRLWSSSNNIDTV
jgi:peptide chain release factor 1